VAGVGRRRLASPRGCGAGRPHRRHLVRQEALGQVGCVNIKGWLLIETLLVLLVANAIVAFVVAMGWPK
jgi:hypothetical protein